MALHYQAAHLTSITLNLVEGEPLALRRVSRMITVRANESASTRKRSADAVSDAGSRNQARVAHA
jgi:hypothetical protein